MAGIEKEIKFFFLFQEKLDYAQKPFFGHILVQNWHVSYYLFHCIVFLGSFIVRNKTINLYLNF